MICCYAASRFTCSQSLVDEFWSHVTSAPGRSALFIHLLILGAIYSYSVYFELQYFCVSDAWLFCIVVKLVICISLGLLYIFVVVSPGLDFVFSVLVKALAGKSISEITCFVSSGM